MEERIHWTQEEGAKDLERLRQERKKIKSEEEKRRRKQEKRGKTERKFEY